jgi:hypothetical protein
VASAVIATQEGDLSLSNAIVSEDGWQRHLVERIFTPRVGAILAIKRAYLCPRANNGAGTVSVVKGDWAVESV